jgi:zinc transporter 1/2/3
VVKAYLSSLFAGDDNEVFPYGVDPAFLRSSESLYKPELQGREAWYYNTSDPTQVPSATNAPYGFFYRHLKVRHTLFQQSLHVDQPLLH